MSRPRDACLPCANGSKWQRLAAIGCHLLSVVKRRCMFARVPSVSSHCFETCRYCPTIEALDKQNGKRENARVIFENDELSDAWDSPDDAMNISVPVSMVLHPSGDIDVVVIDLMRDDERECLAERRIRFTAHAAAQFLDAIGSSAKAQSTHILFGDERPVMATLH